MDAVRIVARVVQIFHGKPSERENPTGSPLRLPAVILRDTFAELRERCGQAAPKVEEQLSEFSSTAADCVMSAEYPVPKW